MIRKVGVFVVGWVIVIVGLALVPLPGPGWAIVFVGLSLLATEFAWAARLKDWVQKQLSAWIQKVKAWREERRRRRTGLVAEMVDDVETVAMNADDDSLITLESLAAPRSQRRTRKEPDSEGIAQ